MAKTVTYNCERERAKASGGVESEIATGCCERRWRERERQRLSSPLSVISYTNSWLVNFRN